MLDETSVQGLITGAYDAALQPESWPMFLESVSVALGSAAILLTVEVPTDGTRGIVFSHGMDPEFIRLYGEYYYSVDPWAPGELPAPGEVWFGRIEEERIIRTEFFADWMRPQEMLPAPTLLGMLRNEPGGISAFSVWPQKGARLPGEAEWNLCQLLVPHFQRAVQVTRRIVALEARQGACEDLLDRLPVAVAFLDERHRVVWTNEPFRALAAEDDGLAICRDGLQAATSKDTRELRRLIAEAAQTANGAGLRGGGPTSLPRPSGRRSLTALAFPIPRQTCELFQSHPTVGVFIMDPERRVEVPTDTLRRLYGLTPAEARLAALLCHGKRLKEVADELGIRLNTARFQLKQVFAKTQTDRQSSLIRLIMGGAGWLPVTEHKREP